jgi:centromere/kinetochore protein ZW10
MVSATLGQAAALSAGGELAQAMVVLEGAERALAEMTGETIVVELMKERAAGLRKSVVERVERGWTEIVCVRKEEGALRIRREITGRASLAFWLAGWLLGVSCCSCW